jgi:hypothetical protein
MKGKNPNSFFRGCQELENNKLLSDLIASIGLDLWYNPAAITNTTSPDNIVSHSISLPANLSFNSLKFIV